LGQKGKKPGGESPVLGKGTPGKRALKRTAQREGPCRGGGGDQTKRGGVHKKQKRKHKNPEKEKGIGGGGKGGPGGTQIFGAEKKRPSKKKKGDGKTTKKKAQFHLGENVRTVQKDRTEPVKKRGTFSWERTTFPRGGHHNSGRHVEAGLKRGLGGKKTIHIHREDFNEHERKG